MITFPLSVASMTDNNSLSSLLSCLPSFVYTSTTPTTRISFNLLLFPMSIICSGLPQSPHVLLIPHMGVTTHSLPKLRRIKILQRLIGNGAPAAVVTLPYHQLQAGRASWENASSYQTIQNLFFSHCYFLLLIHPPESQPARTSVWFWSSSRKHWHPHSPLCW